MATELSFLLETLDGHRRNISLEPERLVLGRGTNVELSYPDDISLSRQHVAFTREGTNWFVEDLGSKNGTFLNGRRLDARVPFQPGDRVVAGRVTVSYASPQSTPLREEQTVLFVESEPSVATRSRTTVVADLASVLMPGVQANFGQPSEKPVLQVNPQMAALVRAGRELAGLRPLAELFDVIMGLAADAVAAQRGVLMVFEGEELTIRAHRGAGFRIPTAVRDRVLNKKESLLLRDAQTEFDPSEQHTIIEQKVHSMLAVPLQTDTRVLGLIYLDTPRRREFLSEDLGLLTVMANVAAIRIEHARLAEVEAAERKMDDELRQAGAIQRGLLPTSDPVVAGLEISGSSIPCRTAGGDYYDFLSYENGELALLVGDVAGKGIAAALLMTSLQARVRVLLDEPDNLASRITRLNQAVCSNCPANRFITFFAGIINPVTGVLRYSNAGHNPPLLIRASGEIATLEAGGMVLGIFRHGAYQEGSVDMGPGDTLLLFSDGITESVDPGGEEYGEKRLADLAVQNRTLSATELAELIHADVHRFSQGAPAVDDITLVVIRKTEAPGV